MSNQYEGSAIAESDEGLGLPVANNAAKQQDSLPAEMSPLQLLYSVVEHNVANPDKRIKLSPEQGKEIMKDFVDFVAGSSDTPTNEDGQPKTFSDMDDNELLKCLSDYLGSGVANTSINGASIELAQDLLAEMYMSEEELAELTNPKTPNARELKERKLLEKMRDAAEAEAAQLKDAREKWDKDDQQFGGKTWNGKELRAFLEWAGKPEVLDAVDQEMIAAGSKPEEVKAMRQKFEEARLLKLKEANGNKLTPQEKKRLEELNNDPQMITYSRNAQQKCELSQKITKEAGLKQGENLATSINSFKEGTESLSTNPKKVDDFAKFMELSAKEKNGDLNREDSQVLARLKQNEEFKEFTASVVAPAETKQVAATDDNKILSARDVFPTAANATDDFRVASTAANINIPAPIVKTPQPARVAEVSSSNISI